MACSFDHTLGPVLPSNQTDCRNFDFTVTFEDVVFTLVPNTLALPLILYRIWLVYRQPKVVRWHSAARLKVAVFICLEALQLAQVVLGIRGDLDPTRLALPSSIIVLVTIAALTALSPLDHSQTSRPSSVIQAYLFFTLLLDGARLRTAWILAGAVRPVLVQTIALAIKTILLLTESVSKDSHLEQIDTLSSEDKAGFFSRSLLLWLNPLLLTGYRKKLAIKDLGPLGKDLEAEKLVQLVDLTFKCSAAGDRRLARALLYAFKSQIFLIQIPRLALVGFSIAQTFLIQSALKYVNNIDSPAQYGYWLITAFALTYVAIAISNLWYQQLTFRLLTMCRGALIGMIFKHTLRLPASESNEASNAINLMSTDISRITQTVQWVLNVIPCAIQVGLALWILYTHLGVVFVAPLIVALVISTVARRVGQFIPPRQQKWMQAIQRRVEVTSATIRNIRGIKISGLSDQAAKQILDRRVAEINDQKAFRTVQVANIAIGNTPAMVTPAVTFAAYAVAQTFSSSNRFTVTTAFTSLSLLSIMINPIAELAMAATNLGSALNCLNRIQEFLEKPSYESARHRPEDADTDSGASVLRLVDATVGYKAEKPILRDIGVAIKPATFTAITGPVGCGKSTLLRALLGEVDILEGELRCARLRQIAYCDQKSWILDVSIRQNILGISKYNEERYRDVVEACQLLPDFEEWPQKDETLAGSSGISLSGGQKARISLARAAYSGKQTLLLDDCLSGLDNETAKKCFNALFSDQGYFRRSGVAVVMASHSAKLLSHADEIIVLEPQGKISARGDFDILKREDLFIRDMLAEQSPAKQSCESSSKDITPLRESPKPSEKEATTADEKSIRRREVDIVKAPVLSKSGTLRYYLSSMGNSTLAMFAALVFLHIGCNIAQPLWLKFWTAANTQDPNENVGLWVGIYILLAFGNVAMIGIETGFAMIRLIPQASLSLHQRLLDATMSVPLSFFVENDSGKIVNILTGDLNLVDLTLPVSFILTSEKILGVAGEIVLACIASGYLAISIPFIALALYFLQRVYLATTRQLRVLELEQKAPLFNDFINTFEGLITLRAYSWFSSAEKQNLALLNNSQKPYYLLFCFARWITLVLNLVTAGQATIVMGLSVALRHDIDPGYLGVALVSIMSFGQTSTALILQWTNLENSLGAVQRIRVYETTAPSEESQDSTGDMPKDSWPTAGLIYMKNVSASYGKHKVLHNVDLAFEPGTKTAICGRSGSGKSTILGLILRLSDSDAGSIQVDGVDIRSLSPKLLRSAVVGLPQDSLLLKGTVRFNLDPYSEHSGQDEHLIEVLKKTGLQDLIAEKGGLDIEMDQDWLSSGQRQLFCLARAMLRKSKILLLDEATSHLDHQTRRTVDRLIKTEFRDWTVIMVTHRLESVLDPELGFDQVVVLDAGRVVEVGQPTLLLQRSDSRFKALVKLEQGSD